MNEVSLSRHAYSLSPHLELAVRAARAAGQVVREGYGALSAIEQKDVGDLVSQVDLDADLAATGVLRAESDLPILSEELHCTTEASSAMWIVDPLDGSSGFLMQAGTQFPAVMVAMREQHETVLGLNQAKAGLFYSVEAGDLSAQD